MAVPTTVNTPQPRARGYGLALGTDLFRPAYGPGRELQMQTAPLEPPAFDTRSNPEELTDSFGRTFARSDFTGGEGLDFAHTREERVNKDSRFFDSANIDVSLPDAGEMRRLRLLPSSEMITTDVKTRAVYDGTDVWVNGQTGGLLRRITNPRAVAPTITTVDPFAGEAWIVPTSTVGNFSVADVAALGDYIYAALYANGIHRWNGTSWSHWSNVGEAVRLWTVKSRIIAATDHTSSAGGSLYEAGAGAGSTLLYTLPVGKTWESVCDAGEAILASATDGNIYAFAADSETGALRLYTQTPIEGELPTALSSAGDIVVFGTRELTTLPGSGTVSYNGRLWRAVLADDLTLKDFQLIREWKSTNNLRYPAASVATRDAIYTAVMEGQTGAWKAWVWKYDLRRGALTRHVDMVGTGSGPAASDLLFVGDTLWVLANAIGGLRRVTKTYASSGYLIGPLGDFLTATVKSWVGARLDADDLPAVADGRTVNLYYSTDPDALTDPAHASWTLVATWDTASDITTAEIPMTGVASRYIAGKITMTPNAAATATPVVRSFGFRAMPGGGGGLTANDRIVNFPVNVSDQLERPNRRAVTIPGLGRRDYDRLRAYEGVACTMKVYEAGKTITMRGLVEAVATPVVGPTERGSSTMYSMVKFRGREV